MTYEEVKAAGFVELRKCSLCDAPIGYKIHPEYVAVIFDASCNCVPASGTYRVATHEELEHLKCS